MIFVAHRINSVTELKKIPRNFGVEVDVRNYSSSLILAHDPFVNGEKFETFLKNFKHAFIIVNIKSEGIEHKIFRLLKKYKIKKYFFLDCSFPMIFRLNSLKKNINFATRLSKFESIESVFKVKNLCQWIWVDCFDNNVEFLKNILSKIKNFNLCIVSPELHNRPNSVKFYAKSLKQIGLSPSMICSKIYNYKIWSKYFKV
jgi:hypothetical protein